MKPLITRVREVVDRMCYGCGKKVLGLKHERAQAIWFPDCRGEEE